ncbi:type II secretion system protein GspN [uncultured Desulfosarcina sp.]|uniref:type II secretion system protein GspN n=1 Tax=uncultured Desulfosarcina sp. TaxID=218289 RepID=UPI0029C78F7B|nr:type II secretion system protein GspN [uncultured Desulfosarcina sp.]
MVSARTIFAYILYALLATAVFMIFLFPGQAVTAYVNRRLAAMDPQLSMEAASVRPSLPPGIKMTGVDFHHGSLHLAHCENARMSAALGSLFKEEKRIRFQTRLADGEISGQAVLGASGPSDLSRAEADLEHIRLDQLDALKAIEQFGLSGALRGHLTHDGGGSPAATTNGKLNVAGLRIALKNPFFGISELIVDQTDMEFSIKGKNLHIKTFTFGGPMVEGKIDGSIQLRTPLGKSRLNLSGNAKPQPELLARLQEVVPQGLVNPRTLGTRGLSFRLRGSVDDPKISTR